jgi:hypothetical protein
MVFFCFSAFRLPRFLFSHFFVPPLSHPPSLFYLATFTYQFSQLHKVWAAMQTDPVDRVDFLTQVLELAPYSEELLALLQNYSSRLAAQLPLLQQVTRREFIKYRLKCIHRFQQDPAKRAEFASGTEGARTRDMLMSELGVLNNKLGNGLQEYERRYTDRFMFRGKPYLDEMAADGRRMPELVAAMGSVMLSPGEYSKVTYAAER